MSITCSRLLQARRAAHNQGSDQVPGGLPDEGHLRCEFESVGQGVSGALWHRVQRILNQAPVQHGQAPVPGGQKTGVPVNTEPAEGGWEEGRVVDDGLHQGDPGSFDPC